LLAFGGTLEWLWPWPLLPTGWPTSAAALLRYGMGSGLVALGMIPMTLGVRAFRRAGTNVETPKPAIRLVTDGIYAWSRNPMYVALVLLFAGSAVLANSGWLGLALMLFVVLLQVGVIAREERYLARKFGAPYLGYRARVRRWL